MFVQRSYCGRVVDLQTRAMLFEIAMMWAIELECLAKSWFCFSSVRFVSFLFRSFL